MLEAKDWQGHARLTRSMARRAQLHGDAERARRLLVAADELDRRAALAEGLLAGMAERGEGAIGGAAALARAAGIVHPIRPDIDPGGRQIRPGGRRPDGRPEADRPADVRRPDPWSVATAGSVLSAAAAPIRLPAPCTA